VSRDSVNDHRKSRSNEYGASILHCGFHVRAHPDFSPCDLFPLSFRPRGSIVRRRRIIIPCITIRRDSPRGVTERRRRGKAGGGVESFLFFTSDLFAAGRLPGKFALNRIILEWARDKLRPCARYSPECA